MTERSQDISIIEASKILLLSNDNFIRYMIKKSILIPRNKATCKLDGGLLFNINDVKNLPKVAAAQYNKAKLTGEGYKTKNQIVKEAGVSTILFDTIVKALNVHPTEIEDTKLTWRYYSPNQCDQIIPELEYRRNRDTSYIRSTNVALLQPVIMNGLKYRIYHINKRRQELILIREKNKITVSYEDFTKTTPEIKPVYQLIHSKGNNTNLLTVKLRFKIVDIELKKIEDIIDWIYMSVPRNMINIRKNKDEFEMVLTSGCVVKTPWEASKYMINKWKKTFLELSDNVSLEDVYRHDLKINSTDKRVVFTCSKDISTEIKKLMKSKGLNTETFLEYVIQNN